LPSVHSKLSELCLLSLLNLLIELSILIMLSALSILIMLSGLSKLIVLSGLIITGISAACLVRELAELAEFDGRAPSTLQRSR